MVRPFVIKIADQKSRKILRPYIQAAGVLSGPFAGF